MKQMRQINPDNKVVFLRDLIRVIERIKDPEDAYRQLPCRELYVKKGVTGTVRETFKTGQGVWHAKIDCEDGVCRTVRLTSVRRCD